VELYLYSPSGPSWTVLWRPLSLPFVGNIILFKNQCLGGVENASKMVGKIKKILCLSLFSLFRGRFLKGPVFFLWNVCIRSAKLLFRAYCICRRFAGSCCLNAFRTLEGKEKSCQIAQETNTNSRKVTFWCWTDCHHNFRKMRDFRLSRQCCWGFASSEKWRCGTGRYVTGV
jgi:hypothetical protein